MPGSKSAIAVVMNFRGRAAQLNLNTAFHQIGNQLLVWIAGCYFPIGIVSLVVQRHVARICVEDCNHLGLCLPVSAIVHDELEVKDERSSVTTVAFIVPLRWHLAYSLDVIRFVKDVSCLINAHRRRSRTRPCNVWDQLVPRSRASKRGELGPPARTNVQYGPELLLGRAYE